eukprot:gene14522-17147_t
MFEFISGTLLTDASVEVMGNNQTKRDKISKSFMDHVGNPLCPLKHFTAFSFTAFPIKKTIPKEFSDTNLLSKVTKLMLRLWMPLEDILFMSNLTELFIGRSTRGGLDFIPLLDLTALTRLVLGSNLMNDNSLVQYLEQQNTLTSLTIKYSELSLIPKLESILANKPLITKLSTPFVVQVPATVTSVTLNSYNTQQYEPLAQLLRDNSSIRRLVVRPMNFTVLQCISNIVNTVQQFGKSTMTTRIKHLATAYFNPHILGRVHGCRYSDSNMKLINAVITSILQSDPRLELVGAYRKVSESEPIEIIPKVIFQVINQQLQ